jgi:hypothetical protein
LSHALRFPLTKAANLKFDFGEFFLLLLQSAQKCCFSFTKETTPAFQLTTTTTTTTTTLAFRYTEDGRENKSKYLLT